MKRALLIAWNDLRLFLREKSGYFWLFGSPLLFAIFMGFSNRGPGSPSTPRPAIGVHDQNGGFMSLILEKELGAEGLNVLTNASDHDRVLTIPKGFTVSIQELRPVKLEFSRREAASMDVSSLAELRLFRALVSLNSHLLEQSALTNALTQETMEKVLAGTNPVTLKSSFGTRKPVPAGYHQSVPGILVMFTMMNLLIFGGATMASERKDGVLRRLLANPLSRRELIFGKIAGLMLLGAVQFGFLLVIGKLFMKMDYAGQLPLLLLVLFVYAWGAAALGVFAGSVILREDKIIAVCVLASMVMAALGGCWWPLEIVPSNVRLAGHIFPTAWAMDAMHQLLSFGGGLAELFQPLLALFAFAAASTFGAVRFFRC